ncbi:hypothetical protein [Dehalogenimonas formicexedens]|uniref:hypothetical protein n=1 Tax=Dehalogenimonas formicexedens TaxID=1839801 RepID=UPI0011AB5204|nr:hypothetical protein [Dehalogenimonas formicexedens]
MKQLYPNESKSIQHCIKLIVVNLNVNVEVAYSKSDAFYTREKTRDYTKTHMLRAIEVLVNDGYIKISKRGSKNIAFKKGISSRIRRKLKLHKDFPKSKTYQIYLRKLPLLRVDDVSIHTAQQAQIMEVTINTKPKTNTTTNIVATKLTINKTNNTATHSVNNTVHTIPLRRYFNGSFCLNYDYFHKMKLDFGRLNLNRTYLRGVGLTRVFVDGDGCGRWYQLHGRSYQQLSKAERIQILLNGDEVAELDYSAMHPHILCAWEKQTTPQNFYESVVNALIVTFPSITRDVVKKVVLMSINAKSKAQLNRAIAKDSFEERKANKTRIKEGRATKSILVDDIKTCGASSEDIVKAFQTSYPFLSKYVYSQSANKLMLVESEIMTLVLEELKKLEIPALPIHDSVLFPKQHATQVKQVMLDCYKKKTGFDIEVK